MSLESEPLRGSAFSHYAEFAAERESALDLSEAERAMFLRVVSASLGIRRHYELLRWLSGELQQFLPHQILLCAWGDFDRWQLKVDLVSPLPGVRTSELARCSIDEVVRAAYGQWCKAGCQPLVLGTSDTPVHECGCRVHGAMRAMRSLLVHGVRDQRSGQDSLYIAMHAGSFAGARSRERFFALVDSLMGQIDVACRKVPVLALRAAPRVAALDLSAREHEILGWVCRGNTNQDIAAKLEISPFTVKNHVQRIFRKIGVSNRTQAAARYNEAFGPAKAVIGQ